MRFARELGKKDGECAIDAEILLRGEAPTA